MMSDPNRHEFFETVYHRLSTGAETIGIAERNDIDPRDGAQFARMIREELADVAAYAKLLDDRVQKIARKLRTQDKDQRLRELAADWRAMRQVGNFDTAFVIAAEIVEVIEQT